MINIYGEDHEMRKWVPAHRWQVPADKNGRVAGLAWAKDVLACGTWSDGNDYAIQLLNCNDGLMEPYYLFYIL